MSLLRDIQAAAIDNSTSIESLLRMCRVLASRLKNDDLKSWVQHELDGYFGDIKVPEYRKMHAHCFGHFSGPFGSGLKNAPIPESCIPADFRGLLTNIDMREGVASIEQLLASGAGKITRPWPAEAGLVFGNSIYKNMVLMQAWAAIPDSFLSGIISTVRNRVLNFVLEIETENPNAGEAPVNTVPIPKESVAKIFNTHIYGNVGNVGAGENFTQTATVNVTQGDIDSLVRALKTHGIGRSDLAELKTAIASDPPKPSTSFGANVGAWLGKMVGKAAEGTWKVTTTVAANLLTTYLKAYYGLQ